MFFASFVLFFNRNLSELKIHAAKYLYLFLAFTGSLPLMLHEPNEVVLFKNEYVNF